MTDLIQVAILGASGYTGAELLRWLQQHPHVQVKALTGDSQAGKPFGDVYPHLQTSQWPDLVKIDEVDFTAIDLVFCCLPHGTTQNVIAGLPENVKIVDLSADFRLHNLDAYAEWYGHAHEAPALQQEAVYGLSEHARQAVSTARLVANPGCYPTSILLPLLPLLGAELIDPAAITVDSLSGVTGAGRSAKQAMLFTEVNEGVKAYGVGGHRHAAEIEEQLSHVVGNDVRISFTPHLMPMQRGILSTLHVDLAEGEPADSLHACLSERYADEAFVHVLPLGAEAPSTHMVRGTNHAMMGVYADRVPNRAIIVSAIDNLVKGAAGQAVQNMNIMYGWPEDLSLKSGAVFP